MALGCADRGLITSRIFKKVPNLQKIATPPLNVTGNSMSESKRRR